MEENLVIVESPAKAKTIEKFLGKNFLVKSSFGHIRDLSKKDLGIHIEKDFLPVYEISPDKKKVVDELKKLAQNAKMVWLASDEDREGEAIAWHLYTVLKLKVDNTKRIVFHEITKDAILNAIKNPRAIDQNLVNAQQARRILDRLVGFELSPLLWKKIKPSLSAGRVQSVAVRLIVEREREIHNFISTSQYKVVAQFFVVEKPEATFKAELSTRFDTREQALGFLENCKKSLFRIEDITVKPAKKSPAPPFTTSTLQQEASRKYGFSVSQTMTIAQRLYESGLITYMRTDSTNLSEAAMAAIHSEIKSEFGESYYKARHYKTKIKGAQEAHEAIRPTYMNNHIVNGNSTEKKLYELIWKRTIASQMADALLEKTTVTISISNSKYEFIGDGEVLKFDGFLKVYSESRDDDSEDTSQVLLPPLKVKEMLGYYTISATERYSHNPFRYSEASLVKKLEELGIGRPSTYAPTISTILARGYVVKEDRTGVKRDFHNLVLKNSQVKEELKSEMTGVEKAKLFPTDIGMVVNDFLVDYFKNILDYNFTATVEKEFDEIAEGNLVWNHMIAKFYKTFHKQIVETSAKSERSSGERALGTDPLSGKKVSVRIGRFGPMAQLGENEGNGNDKPRYAPLRKDQFLETVTLEQTLELFKLPREIGIFEDKPMTVAVGRFGPYIKHDNKFYALKKEDDPLALLPDRAIQIIHEKRIAEKNKLINELGNKKEIKVLNGRFGPYFTFEGNNYKIPKSIEPTILTFEQCQELIKNQGPSKAVKRGKAFKTERTAKQIKPAQTKKISKAKGIKKTGKITISKKKK